MTNATQMSSHLEKFIATHNLAEIVQRINETELGNKDFECIETLSTFALMMRDFVWALTSDAEILARGVLAKKEAVDKLFIVSFGDYISTMILVLAMGFMLGTMYCRRFPNN